MSSWYSSPLERPGSIAVPMLLGAAMIVAFVLLGPPGPGVTVRVILVATGTLGFMSYLLVRRPESRTARARTPNGTISALSHLAVTLSVSIAVASYAYDARSLQNGEDLVSPELADAMRDFAIVSTWIGGTLALFRSSNTHARTEEALAEIQDLKATMNVGRMLFGLARTAPKQPDTASVLALVGQMAEEAVKLPELPDGVATLTVWARRRDRWVIVAGHGITQETVTSFSQRVLAGEEDGAGVVANLAATATSEPWIRHRDVQKERWYMKNPKPSGPVEGMAAVLLGAATAPVGALCITTRRQDVIPGPWSPRREGFEYMLLTWAAAFTMAASRLSFAGGEHAPPPGR